MKAVNHSTFRKATQIAIEKKDSKILLFAKCLKSPIALKEFAMIQIKENRMSFFKSGEKVKAFHLKNLRNPSKLLNYIQNRVNKGEHAITIPSNFFLKENELVIEGDFGSNFDAMTKHIGTDNDIKHRFRLFNITIKEINEIRRGETPERLHNVLFYDFCSKVLGCPSAFKGKPKLFWLKLAKK